MTCLASAWGAGKQCGGFGLGSAGIEGTDVGDRHNDTKDLGAGTVEPDSGRTGTAAPHSAMEGKSLNCGRGCDSCSNTAWY